MHRSKRISMYELGYCLLLLSLCERKLTIFPKGNIRNELDLFSRSRQVLILSYRLNIAKVTFRPFCFVCLDSFNSTFDVSFRNVDVERFEKLCSFARWRNIRAWAYYEIGKCLTLAYIGSSPVASPVLKKTFKMPGSQNCPLNFHRKFPRNILTVFDAFSETQSDCKQYFGFAVEEFAGITGASKLFDSWADHDQQITQESRMWRCSENLSTTNPK